MEPKGIAEKIFNFVSSILVWFFVAVAIIAIYFYFNQELLEKFIKLLIIAFIYSAGLVIAIWFRQKKHRVNKQENSSEISIYINQFDLLKHELLMFLTPLAIILAAFIANGELDGKDIIYSIIAFIGLYLSELIYKRRINN